MLKVCIGRMNFESSYSYQYLHEAPHGGPRGARVGYPIFTVNNLPDSDLVTPNPHHRIVENEISESIYARTEALQALRELGPPDLVHLTKSQPKAGIKEVKGSS